MTFGHYTLNGNGGVCFMSDTEREAMDKDLDIDEQQSEDVAGGVNAEVKAAVATTEKRVSVEQPPQPL
jgi:hypothetical protein